MIGSDYDDNLSVFYAKIVGLKKGSDSVEFQLKTKNPSTDKYEVVKTAKPATKIGGELVKLAREEFEWEGETIRVLKVYLKDTDAGQLVILSLNLNNMTRSLINGLAGTENLNGWYTLSTFISNNGMPNMIARRDDEKLEWKYTWEEFASKVEVVKVGKTDQKVYDELNDWLWEEVLPEIIGRFTPPEHASEGSEFTFFETTDEHPVKDGEKTVPSKKTKALVEQVEDESPDDLPF